MAKKKKNFIKRYLYIFIAIIIVFSIILFLLLGNSKRSSNFVGIQAYKYKTGMDEYRYYVEKINSSKIIIDKTYDVRCYESNCSFVKGYFANGNVYDSLAVLYDDSNYYLIDFEKKTREELEIGRIKYVNFTSDGSYLFLFTSNNSMYAYNIAKKTVSSEIHFDYILYEDSFETMDNKMFIYVDNVYKMVNLDSGKIDKVTYDNVRKVSNYYVLTMNGKDHLYKYNKKFTGLNLSFDKILDVKEDYVLVVDNKELHLVDINEKDNSIRLLNNYNYDYINMSYDSDFVNITLSNKKCHSLTYSLTNDDVNITNVECPIKNLTKSIYVSSNKDENIVITYGKDLKNSYDLTVTKNDFLYDIYGKYYDKVEVDYTKSNITFETGFDVTKDSEFSFMKDKFELLGLSNKMQNDYFNKIMPILLSNKENFIYFDVNTDNDNSDYKILNNLDSYVSIDIYITNKFQNLPVQVLDKLDNSGFSAVVLSIN